MNLISVATVIAAGASVVAAVAAVYTVIVDRRRDRRQVRVTVSAERPSDFPRPILMVEAKNVGSASVTLIDVGFQLPDGDTIHQGNGLQSVGGLQGSKRNPYISGPITAHDPYPARAAVLADVLADQIRSRGLQGTVTLIPFVRDRDDRRYDGQPFLFNLDTMADEL